RTSLRVPLPSAQRCSLAARGETLGRSLVLTRSPERGRSRSESFWAMPGALELLVLLRFPHQVEDLLHLGGDAAHGVQHLRLALEQRLEPVLALLGGVDLRQGPFELLAVPAVL